PTNGNGGISPAISPRGVTPAQERRVIWFFHKGTAELRLETRFDSAVGDYVAVFHFPDGTQQTERFSDEQMFRVYLFDLERRLERERWRHDPAPSSCATAGRILHRHRPSDAEYSFHELPHLS